MAQDLRDLFRVVPSELEKSETQQMLDALHADQRKATNYVRDHLDFLQFLPRYAGKQLAVYTVCCILFVNEADAHGLLLTHSKVSHLAVVAGHGSTMNTCAFKEPWLLCCCLFTNVVQANLQAALLVKTEWLDQLLALHWTCPRSSASVNDIVPAQVSVSMTECSDISQETVEMMTWLLRCQ